MEKQIGFGGAEARDLTEPLPLQAPYRSSTRIGERDREQQGVN
jgi:hypothetical protein